MGIVCPQYYLQENGETTFPQHLEIVWKHYYNPCPCGQAKREKSTPIVFAILSGWDLHAQQGLFKLNMIFNILKPWLKSWPLHPQKNSLLTSFHTRLPMRCGLTFHQQILKVDMLEFCYWFCAPLFNCLLLHRTSLAQAYCQIICWHLVHIGALIVRGYSQSNGAHCHHGLCNLLHNRPRAFS